MSEGRPATLSTTGRAGPSAWSVADWLFERFLEIFVYSSLWLAGGMAALVLFAQRVLGLGFDLRPAALILLSALFIYNLDHVIDSRVQQVPEAKARRYFKHPGLLILLVAAAVGTGILAGTAPVAVKAVFAGYMSIGLLYGLPVVPVRHGGERHWYRLKDIPLMKAWLVAFTVTCAVVGLTVTYAGAGWSPDAWAFGVFVLIFGLTNTHMSDVRDIDSDRDARVFTLPIALGHRRTRLALVALNLVLLALWMAGWSRPMVTEHPAMIVAVVATLVYVLYLDVRTPPTVFRVVVDGCPYLPWILALLIDVAR